MSVARQVLRGTTYLLTRRCTQRRYLLRPSEKTNANLQYCLAVASDRYGILMHSYCFMSNHYHMVITDERGVLPEFLRYFNEMSARSLNALHGRREALWGSDRASVVQLAAVEDTVEKGAYTLANPVAAGLVARGYRWPGLWSDPRLIGGPAVTVERPEGFFRRKGPMPERASIRLVRPPGFETDADFVAALTRALREHEDAAHEAQRGPDGETHFLGEKAVLRQEPTDGPTTLEPRRRLIPRIAARDPRKRAHAIQRLKEFLREYREAWLARRAGLGDVLFPAGTWWQRIYNGVACACAPP